MAPTESSILSDFLLSAATLSSAISFEEFADLFPSSKQGSSEIGQLYRELQHQRAIDADDVKYNIEAEIKRGEKMKRDVARTRKAENHDHGVDGVDATDTAMEFALFGPHDNAPKSVPHNLRTIRPAITNACQELEGEIAEMEAEAMSLFHDAQTVIGDLSGLQYGRISQSGGGVQEALESARRLQEVCRSTGDKT